MNSLKQTSILVTLLMVLSISAFGGQYIAEMNEDGSGQHLIYSHTGDIATPGWSPDMTSLTFYSSTSTTGKSEIFSYDISQDEMCQLTSYGHNYGQSSPQYYDDTTIWYTFHYTDAGHSELAQLIVDGCTVLSDIVLSDYHATGRQRGEFDLSDNYICYYVQNSSNSYTGELFLAPLSDLTDTTQLTSGGGSDKAADICPDETKIVYLNEPSVSAARNIYTMDIDGSNKTPLTFITGTGSTNNHAHPLWSSDCSQICYSYYDGVQWDVFIMNADGTDSVNITNTPGYNEVGTEWKNGKILFYTDREIEDLNILYIPEVATCLENGQFIVPLMYDNETSTTSMNIPIIWDNPYVCLDSISTVGTACETWTQSDTINCDEQYAVLGLFDLVGDSIVSGSDVTIANLYFSSLDVTSEFCNLTINYDTAFSEVEEWRLLFVDNSNPPNEFTPTYDFITSEIGNYVPGDVNRGGTINILDITYLINYLYKGGVAPICLDAADADGNCLVNILDVTYLISYIYKGGPAPVCGCAESGSGAYKQSYFAEGQLNITYQNGNTLISSDSPIDMAGIELILKSNNCNRVVLNNQIDKVALYSNQEDDMIHLALIDITGENLIQNGNQCLLSIDGEVEIVHALGSDENSNAIKFDVHKVIPDQFSLSQNYPNPFNPTTVIEAYLPVASDYSLEIYNVAGQKVADYSGHSEAGVLNVEWDASNQASGMYFYRFEAGEFKDSKKMVLLK